MYGRRVSGGWRPGLNGWTSWGEKESENIKADHVIRRTILQCMKRQYKKFSLISYDPIGHIIYCTL